MTRPSRDAGHFIQNPKPHRAWRGRVRPARGCFVNGSARQSAQAVLARSLHCLAVPQIMALVSTTVELSRSTVTYALKCQQLQSRMGRLADESVWPFEFGGSVGFFVGESVVVFHGNLPETPDSSRCVRKCCGSTAIR
jgi:hypothetical protein